MTGLAFNPFAARMGGFLMETIVASISDFTEKLKRGKYYDKNQSC